MYRFTFQHPTTVVIAGPTQCGKTHFLAQCLREQRLEPWPERIVWVYGEWQKAYDELRNSVVPSISFVHNFNNQLYDTFNANTRNMLILDDQMENNVATARRGQGVVKFFTQGSHHRNLTVVYMVQNLFNQDPAMRTVSLNAH